jgi:GT2 family glycosyltransferase
MKKIVISIIDYKGKENTVSCLASLEKIVVPKNFTLDVVIINNYPTDVLSIRNIYKNFTLTVLQNTTNSGFSGGHNVSFSFAKEHDATYTLVMNNDVTVDSKLLSELVSVAEGDQKIGMVCPKIYFSKGSEYHKDRYTEKELGHVFWYAGGLIDWNNVLATHRGVDEVDHGQYDKTEETEFATGCCFLIRMDVVKEIKGFDERYFLYLEDLDLNMRVKSEGYKVLYAPTARLWHHNAGSTGGSGSNLQDYFTTRNRLLFAHDYASLRARFALFRESLRLLHQGREWQRNGVVDYYLHRFGKGRYNV